MLLLLLLLVLVVKHPEFAEWLHLQDSAGIAVKPQQLQQQANRQQRSKKGDSSTSSRTGQRLLLPAVVLPPGQQYDITILLQTTAPRRMQQSELGVISQLLIVTAAVAAAAPANANSTSSGSSAVTATHAAGTGGSIPGWDLCIACLRVAGGLIAGDPSGFRTLLRADAKPFVPAALRRLFATPTSSTGPHLMFLPAPNLSWDVPMQQVCA